MSLLKPDHDMKKKNKELDSNRYFETIFELFLKQNLKNTVVHLNCKIYGYEDASFVTKP